MRVVGPMLELTGIAPFFELVSWAYWVLAGFFVWFAYRANSDRRRRIAVVAFIAIAFSILPALSWWHTYERKAYAAAARAHYEKLCAERAGIKIYRKVSGVKSLVVLKPLPPSTDADNFNQYWYGDPYSGPASDIRQKATYSTIVSRLAPIDESKSGEGFDFIEVPAGGEIRAKRPFVRIWTDQGSRVLSTMEIDAPTSRYGISWEDMSTEFDRKYWVSASRLAVIDTLDQFVVAERVGYSIEGGLGSRAGGRRPWLTSHGPMTTCPESSSYTDRRFLIRALDPHGARSE